MITTIFVHGTGVRESSYSQTFGKISQRLAEFKNLRLYPCYWGGKFGVSLHQGGASIPDFDKPKGLLIPWKKIVSALYGASFTKTLYMSYDF